MFAQVLVGEQCYGPWRKTPLSAQAEELVSRSISRAKLAKFGFKHVALPSELLSRTERERISRYGSSFLYYWMRMSRLILDINHLKDSMVDISDVIHCRSLPGVVFGIGISAYKIKVVYVYNNRLCV